MERPDKRPRLAYTERGREPSRDNVHAARRQNDSLFKSALESIFDKYSQDFTGVGDELNLESGQIVVDNGHLEGLEQDWDRTTADLEIRRTQRKAARHGRSILRAVTAAPENCDIPISSIEEESSAQFIQAWLGGDGSATTVDGNSDTDSLLAPDEDQHMQFKSHAASSSRQSSQDSLAEDEPKVNPPQPSPTHDHQLQGCKNSKREFRSISIDSLAENEDEVANVGKDDTYRLSQLDKSVEQAWEVPDIGGIFSTPTRQPLQNSTASERPFVLSSVLNSIAKPTLSQPKSATAPRARKKRSESIASDSSEDPLQQP